jgi:hypothetical protein
MFVVSIVHSCAVPTYDLMMSHHMLTQSMQFPDSILQAHFTMYMWLCVKHTSKCGCHTNMTLCKKNSKEQQRICYY